MISIARRVLQLLSPRERRTFYLLLPAVVFMSFFEVVGVASITPFLALVSNPQVIQENIWLARVYTLLGFSSTHNFLIFAGVAALITLTLSNTYSAFITYHVTRFSQMRSSTLSSRLLIRYLHRPYTFFLGQNTSGLGASLLTEVQQVVTNIIVPGMRLVARCIMACFIITLLFLVDPVLALTVSGALGVIYGTLMVLTRKKLRRIGKIRLASNRQRFKVANEALGGIKDLKLLGREQLFINQFSRAAQRFARTQATGQVISSLPRYALETVAFGGIIIIVLYLMARGQGLEQALPLVGLYAFATYRLMPALQDIFAGVTTIRFYLPALNTLHQELRGPDPTVRPDRATLPALLFEDKLVLDALTFAYPDALRPAVKDMTLSIHANTSVAFVGHTGSGKTTLVDLILGLLTPQVGTLKVDNVRITEDTLPRWQKSIGYVPQHIYLADDSVASNIAFGVPREAIDLEAVERAARIANIHEFITHDLAEGYDTVVGEHGIRLSGGQRQRLGIARALYHDPSVLVLDEATSALDSITEENVFKAVDDLMGKKTIIMIAHRLSTVRDCDQIFLLDKGTLSAQGTFEDLVTRSATFRAMAASTSQTYPQASWTN